jgi:hypothetical protein
MLRLLLNASAAAGASLAFIWPIVVSREPGDPTFKVIAIVALVALLASLVLVIVSKARR